MVGKIDGIVVVGITDGNEVGTADGIKEEKADGFIEGIDVINVEGAMLGLVDGYLEGIDVGPILDA